VDKVNVNVEQQGHVTIVRPAGRLDFGSAGTFQQEMEGIMAGVAEARGRGDAAAVVIEGSSLEYVSSAGLRVFLVAARAAQQCGAPLAVCGLVPAVRAVFDMSGFERVVELRETLSQALDAVG